MEAMLQAGDKHFNRGRERRWGGNTSGVNATGGSANTGGSKATGGIVNTGGNSAVGGATSVGGSLTTGGNAPFGGMTATGGTKANGGTASVGGTTGTGGTKETGGAVATGGTKSTGGTTSTGGTRATGGAATGGNNAAAAGAGSLGNIYSGVPWLDTSGNLVNAHGVGFIKVGNTYYMVGEQRSGANDTYSGAAVNMEDTFTGVSMYSTTDFVNWTFVGTVVTPISGTVVAPPYYGERPKILYNTSTSKYIIYIKMLNYTGNPLTYTGYYAVLTSSNISGPYTYNGNLSLTGANDFQVFEDSDGSQYLVRDGGTLYKFSTDGLSIASTVKERHPEWGRPIPVQGWQYILLAEFARNLLAL